jgi:hypothetical protein
MDLLIVLAAAVTLAVPGRTSANPSIAVDRSFVAVAWSASDAAGATDVFVATSRDGAVTFGAATRVNDSPGDARANGEQPPRVVLSGRSGAMPAITVVWTAKGRSGTRLVSARSDDGGRSFSAAATVADSDAPGNRGWHNATADRSGRVYTVWLDHRELAHDEGIASSHHDHTGAKPDGVAMAQRSKLFVASLDGAVAPHAVTGGVCYCCKTALATGSDGAIYAAWRHVYAGNMRDIAFSASRDGGRSFSAPVRVSEDRWMLEGCPDDGPSLAVDGRNRVHVVWPTLVGGETAQGEEGSDPSTAIFYASSRDGRVFTPRVKLPTEGMPHHPQIVVSSEGSIVAAWDEGYAGKRRAVIARAQPGSGGDLRFTRTVIGHTDGDLYPAIAGSGGTTVAAWVANRGAGSVIAVSRLP